MIATLKLYNCTSIDTDLLTLKGINQFCNNVYRAIRQSLPTLPKNINEVYNYLDIIASITNIK